MEFDDELEFVEFNCEVVFVFVELEFSFVEFVVLTPV